MSVKVNYSEHLRGRILSHLRTKWRYDEGGSSWKSFSALAKELRAPLPSVKREVRRLARAGLVGLTWLYHEERGVCGRGYILTRDGEGGVWP